MVERRRQIGMTGAMLALGLTTLPALAQEPPDDPGVQPPPPVAGQAPTPGRPGAQNPPRNRGQFTQPAPYLAAPGQPVPGPGGQFGPGGPPGWQPVPMMPMPQTPELAKKTRAIMALREMLGMRLTARNIAAALPILKDLRDTEKAMQNRTEQLLEEERRALLAADPDDPMPPGAGERMQQEMQRFQEKQRRAWEELEQTIGQEKTNGIRRLLGQGGFPPNSGGFRPMDPGLSRPGVGAPPGAGPFTPGPGGQGPALAPGQRNRLSRPGRGSDLPPEPTSPPPADDPTDEPLTVLETPLTGVEPVLAAPEGEGLSAPAALAHQQPPVSEPRTGGRRAPLRATPRTGAGTRPYASPQSPLTDVPVAGTPTAPSGLTTQPPPYAVVQAQPGQPGRPGQTPRPNQRGRADNPFAAPGGFGPGGQPGQPMPNNAPFFPSPRLTLAELVELMEQKLAAMRR